MKIKVERTITCIAGGIALIGILLLLNQQHHSPAPVPTPTATPKFLIHIPGITEPTNVFPCHNNKWDTLEFGITTEEQLVQWLKTSTWVHRDSFGDGWREPVSPDSYKVHFYSWLIVEDSRIFRNSVGLDVVSGTLTSLWSPLFYSQTLEGIVKTWGDPQLIAVHLNNRYEECAYTYAMYYPEQGIRVGGSLYDNRLCQRVLEKGEAPLEKEWPVTELTCSRSGTIEEVLSAMYAVTPEAAKQIARSLQPWNGFGYRYRLCQSERNPCATP